MLLLPATQPAKLQQKVREEAGRHGGGIKERSDRLQEGAEGGGGQELGGRTQAWRGRQQGGTWQRDRQQGSRHRHCGTKGGGVAPCTLQLLYPSQQWGDELKMTFHK